MSISLPTNIEIKQGKDNRAQITIEPCYPGYGVTLGNSLRRALLSSIEGGAITSFKINGVQHEFSSLPNIKEDVIEMMLNFKAIRLKVFSDEPVVLNIKAKGEKVVTAKDIEKNSQVEIVNPEQTVCTLTDKSSEIEMELVVQKGYGYVTVEEREKEKVAIGTIIIDAIYSPVLNVGFDIESIRVGERTDYERLILNISTDGTITPEEALKQAAQILVEQFNFIKGDKVAKKASPKAAAQEEAPEKKEDKPIKEEEAVIDSEEAEKPKKKRGRPKKDETK